MKKKLTKYAVALLITGIILAIKPVYDWLSFGGFPVIQLIIGVVAVGMAVALFLQK